MLAFTDGLVRNLRTLDIQSLAKSESISQMVVPSPQLGLLLAHCVEIPGVFVS
eukprot:SAG31_NODE_3064_length_4732_cov_4.692833_7_plen_52_part_01